MKNSKGWGLQAMLVFCLIFFIFLIIAVFLIVNSFKSLPNNSSDSNSNPAISNSDSNSDSDAPKKDYKDLEQMMIDATSNYILNNYTDKELDFDHIIVTLNTLVEKEYIEQLYDVDTNRSKCSGYVDIEKEESGITYKPYLRCGLHYKTSGYNKDLDV